MHLQQLKDFLLPVLNHNQGFGKEKIPGDNPNVYIQLKTNISKYYF